jgi:hypothetical protein
MERPELEPRNAKLSCADLERHLAQVDRQLERADEIENPMERYRLQDVLWEKRAELEAELADVLRISKQR